MIPVPRGVRVCLAAGQIDMRRGMNGLGIRSTPSGWRRAASSDRRQPTAWSGSRHRSWPICSTESTGGTRATPSGQSAQARDRGSHFGRAGGADF